MAAISPSSSSSAVPPTSLSEPSIPPPSSQPSPIEQPTATPPNPNPNSSFAQSPFPNNPPSNNSTNPSQVSSPPPVEVDSSPPPIPSAPTSPPPPIVAQPPPINASPPQLPPPEASSPPPLPVQPPVSSPPPLPTPTPPSILPPTPPLSTSPPPTSSPSPPPPQPSSPPPHVSSPTPPLSNPTLSPPPLPNPPTSSPPPPTPALPNPPTNSPPSSNPSPPTPTLPNPPTTSPPSSIPLKNSPPPPSSSKPPRASSSPPPPAASGQPRRSPPSDSHSAPPPSVIPPVPPAPVSPSRPSSGSQTTVISPPSPALPSNSPPINVPQTTSSGPSSNGGISSGGIVGIGVVVGLLLLGLVGLVAFCMFKKKKRSSRANGGHVIPSSGVSSPGSDAKLFIKTEYPDSLFGGSSSDTTTERGGFGHSRSLFTYQDLFAATGEFSDQNLLGEGGFGCVYKGILPDGRLVAVKQLKIGASQGEREFKAEVEIIGRIHHRHLVSLVGYCISDSKRLLVYEYVPNNTLHFHLHGEGRADLDWAQRIKIAAGAARGIAYLHEDCQPRIIHRDIKSSNILLDNNFVARVSDFGLAKLAMDADTHVSTRVMGTFGYMAPEYATSGKLTEKSDVYSFGVVLLELITGRKPVDVSQPLGDEGLVEWARPLLTHALDTGELEGLVDLRLNNNYVESQIYLMIEAAAACVRHSAAKRPRMGQVVRAFDGISDSGDLSNGLRVGESQLYDSAQQSAEIKWFRRMAFGSQAISTDFFSQPTQSEHNNGNFSARQGQSVNFSKHASQDVQNQGFSGQSGQNVNFSARHGHSGNSSRQPSQDAQNLGFSRQTGQNVNFSDRHGQSGNITRQQGVDAQNPSFMGASRQNVYSSAQHDFDDDISR